MHLSVIVPTLKVGSVWPAGVGVAESGNTGNSTGPHLHIECSQHAAHRDPRVNLYPFFREAFEAGRF